ncbi:MAG TPA: hypothetical protein VGH34_11030, partial [Vicinamibacterales bacterium]
PFTVANVNLSLALKWLMRCRTAAAGPLATSFSYSLSGHVSRLSMARVTNGDERPKIVAELARAAINSFST